MNYWSDLLGRPNFITIVFSRFHLFCFCCIPCFQLYKFYHVFFFSLLYSRMYFCHNSESINLRRKKRKKEQEVLVKEEKSTPKRREKRREIIFFFKKDRNREAGRLIGDQGGQKSMKDRNLAACNKDTSALDTLLDFQCMRISLPQSQSSIKIINPWTWRTL